MNLSPSIDILEFRERLNPSVQKKQIVKDLDKQILSAHYTILPLLMVHEEYHGKIRLSNE